jgi:hypothetical protein
MPSFSIHESIEQSVSRYYRRQRLTLALGLTGLFGGAAGYFLLRSAGLSPEVHLILLSACATVFVSGLAIILSQYLRGGFSPPHYDQKFYGGPELDMSEYTLHDDIRQEVAKLRSDLAGLQAGKPQDQYADLVSEFRGSITKEIVEEVEKRLSADALAKAQLQEFRNTFANSYTRLAAALAGLNRRGNLNLVIGVITTILAASLLAYMALKAPAFTTMPDILAHYIPRLSTVIFIEVFSFFFLRLYKATLDESKFYQMELIAMARVDLAIQAALRSADLPTMTAVVGQLAASRNNNTSPEKNKQPDFDAKNLADILEKLGKLVVEVGKSKG